jgi:hypothetical protein
MGVPIMIDSDQLDALNSKLDRVLAELDAMRNPASKVVGTAEAALMLGIAPRTVREWHKLGQMPKVVSKEGQNLMWSRLSIERLAEGRSGGGRHRSND